MFLDLGTVFISNKFNLNWAILFPELESSYEISQGKNALKYHP